MVRLSMVNFEYRIRSVLADLSLRKGETVPSLNPGGDINKIEGLGWGVRPR